MTPIKNIQHKFAFMVIAILLLFIFAMLPFALSSIFQDIIEQSNVTYKVQDTTSEDTSADNVYIHADMVSINEWDGTANIRVSAHNNCLTNCFAKRLVFSSVLDDSKHPENLPSSQEITLPDTKEVVTENITIPLFGDPIRYPFDEYKLGLGVEIENIDSSGQPIVGGPKASERLGFYVQARVPRMVMAEPKTLTADSVDSSIVEEDYASIQLLSFSRPLYLRILTVVLILLITVAAACAVFMRPLNEIVINAGALVLGIWGIRSILLGVTIPGITSVDLALSTIILFVLVAITLRTFHFLDKMSGANILHKSEKKD